MENPTADESSLQATDASPDANPPPLESSISSSSSIDGSRISLPAGYDPLRPLNRLELLDEFCLKTSGGLLENPEPKVGKSITAVKILLLICHRYTVSNKTLQEFCPHYVKIRCVSGCILQYLYNFLLLL